MHQLHMFGGGPKGRSTSHPSPARTRMPYVSASGVGQAALQDAPAAAPATCRAHPRRQCDQHPPDTPNNIIFSLLVPSVFYKYKDSITIHGKTDLDNKCSSPHRHRHHHLIITSSSHHHHHIHLRQRSPPSSSSSSSSSSSRPLRRLRLRRLLDDSKNLHKEPHVLFHYWRRRDPPGGLRGGDSFLSFLIFPLFFYQCEKLFTVFAEPLRSQCFFYQ